MKKRKFIAYIKILGWWCLSLGVHIDIRAPHISIHFPFGFATIGWEYPEVDENYTWETGLYGIG